jgi:tRNA threonylcarbamoyladenosine biosynthesis protein TsaB
MILHIETATDICSVSLSKNGKQIDIQEKSEERSHASTLTVFINEIFERNRLSANELSAVAVSMGPGSYTGLRIGVSVAKGICYGTDIPLIAIPTLEAMYIGLRDKLHLENHEIPGNSIFAPMIDARRMEVYMSMFNSEGVVVRETSAIVVEPETFNDILRNNKIYFFGTGAAKLNQTIIHDNAIFIDGFELSSNYMIPIAERKLKNKLFENVAYFEPFYLKDFIATIPKNKMKFKTEAD